MHTFIDFEYFQVKQSFNNKQNASWTLFVFGNNIFTVLLLETRQENWRWKQEKHFSFNSSLGRLVLIAVNLITTVLRGLGIRFFKEFFLQHNSILEYQRRKSNTINWTCNTISSFLHNEVLDLIFKMMEDS